MPTPQPASGDHYFATTPAGPSSPRSVDLVLPEGRLLHLHTDRGVFSANEIDAGTRILLAEPGPDPSATTLVDLGAGYGPISLALALRAPNATVWAVEVNERARALCRQNAEANGVQDRVKVVAPDEVPADLVVDEIWSNPPIRIGKPALHDLLSTWLHRLRPGIGSARLVVQKHLGADSLARWLDEQGWPTERQASRAGYRILSVNARAAAATSDTAD